MRTSCLSSSKVKWEAAEMHVPILVLLSEWVKVTQSCLTLCDFRDYTVHGILQARILEWVAFPFSRGSSGDLPNPGVEPGLLHCRQILFQLNHKGSPRILEWVAYPFSRGSSWPRNWTGVSCIAGRFFTSWATRKSFWVLLGECNKTTNWGA